MRYNISSKLVACNLMLSDILLYVVPLTVAQLSVDASFNDTRCEDGGTVCPTDPLLFTCIVSDSPIVDITVTFPSGDEIDLTVGNMITGDLPDGVHVKSHNVTVDGTFNYVLTLKVPLF